MNKGLGKVLRVVYILCGAFLSAIAINEFLVPHHLLSGGVSGISLIVQYMSGIPSGVMVLAINLPIFLMGIKEIDRDFVIYSLLGTLSLSFFLIVLRDVRIFEAMRVDDTMLSCIFGGALNGLGCGIVFKNRGSTGGIDIVAVVVKKRRSTNIGSVLFIINLVIVLLASALFGVKPALFTLVSMYVSAMVLDKVQEGFDRKKSVLIICDRESEVADAIMKSMDRGVTFLHGEGAYTGTEREILYCIVTTRQLAQVKHIVQNIDPRAFFAVSDTAEVMGKGFKNNGI